MKRKNGFCIECEKDMPNRSKLTLFCYDCLYNINHKTVHQIVSELRAEIKYLKSLKYDTRTTDEKSIQHQSHSTGEK